MPKNPVYRTRVWPVVRLRVLARDGWKCRIGLPGCKGRANAVDHIVELEDGGAPFDERNLQAACIPCNTAKFVKAREARKRGQEPGRVRSW